MEQVAIATLNPELPGLETKQFRAVVTLIWPYSSSQRQFALLLGDPSFRLRRRAGQVRARFSGSSAKAIASTGVGIGDEIVLSLRGAEFVQDGSVSTPGKSIDWELSYTQTLSAHILRDDNEIASLDLINAAPTPAPRSPVRQQPPLIVDEAHKWSSPAFVKKTRLSNRPVFEAGYDPFNDDTEDGHDRKRRRKSYRDWNAWTYSARTPSPEKEDVYMDDYNSLEGSPTRPAKQPVTPVSPPKPQVTVAVRSPLLQSDGSLTDVERQPGVEFIGTALSSAPRDDFMRDVDYYELYAGPNELAPSGAQDVFLGSTESSLEIDDVSVTPVASQFSLVEPDLDYRDEENSRIESPDAIEVLSVSDAPVESEPPRVSTDGALEVDEADVTDKGANSEHGHRGRALSGIADDLVVLHEAPEVVMPPPPPVLPLLQTEFQPAYTPGLLTPIGKEPSSPTLLPLDSATLPIPSPFPGERDGNALSYLEHVNSNQLDISEAVQAQSLNGKEDNEEEEYLVETSFYSSVSASHDPPFHATHESAFTDVRFTFGMDGSNFSHPEADKQEIQDPLLVEGPTDIEEPPSAYEEEQSPDVVDKYTTEDLPKTIADSPPPEPTLPQQQPKATEPHPANGRQIEQRGDIAVGTALGSFSNWSEKDSSAEDSTEPVQFEGATFEDLIAEAPVAEEPVPHHDERFAAATEIIELSSDSVHDETLEQHNAEMDPRPASLQVAFEQDHQDEEMPDLENAANDRPSPSSSAGGYADGTDYSSRLVTENHQSDEGHPILAQSGIDEEAHNHDRVATDDEYPIVAEEHDHMFDIDIEQSKPSPDEQLAEDHHPDIKMESIEDEDGLEWNREHDMYSQQENDGPMAGPSAELLISVPDEGHKVGEMHLVSVPATGPARNTRSKTKASMSPVQEITPGRKRSTRSKTSKGTVASVGRTTVSPLATRSLSITSPTKDMMTTPSYNLRSQSKRFSRTESTTPTAESKSTRKGSARFSSVDEQSPSKQKRTDRDYLRPMDLDFPDDSFDPSQELGLSQSSKYADVSFVKDSEEGSLHSELSLSTVQYSDDWNMGMQQAYAGYSGSARHEVQKRKVVPSPLKPRPVVPGMLPSTPTRPAKSTPPPAEESLDQHLPQSSPSSLSVSAEAVASSPRRSQRLRRDKHGHPLEKDFADHMAGTAAAAEPSQPVLTVDSSDVESRSSLPPSSDLGIENAFTVGEQLPSSPPAAQSAFTSTNQQSHLESNMPLTPDATQQTFPTSQPSFPIAAQKQSIPMTPQLTQTTSAGLRSFKVDVEMEGVTAEPLLGPSPAAKSTPRRNVTDTDVASEHGSPKIHSANVSDSDKALQTELPSVGLSTPIAYYTPLKDLPFFLNRSSQFHSSSYPDVFALVTSASTPPKRATSGPKHHTTTLHIADVSSYPMTTTVQVFRPYVTALPVAERGDVILLRGFVVKSLNRRPMLTSGEESAWCVWRFSKLFWGKKRGPFGEIKEREEVKGPAVERGEGEWREVEKVRAWYVSTVKQELEDKEAGEIKTRSKDKGGNKADGSEGVDRNVEA